MRVDPSLLVPPAPKSPVTKIAILILSFALLAMIAAPDPNKWGDTLRVEPSSQVVVASRLIAPGERIELQAVRIEQRPDRTLPADAVHSFGKLRDKIAIGPIPAGYPLSAVLLTDLSEVAAAPSGTTQAALDTAADLADVHVDSEELSKPGMEVNFAASAKSGGEELHDETEKIAAEDPPVTTTAPSPETAQAAPNIPDAPRPPGSGQGYVWVKDQGTRYGLAADGSIKVIDDCAKRPGCVSPLKTSASR